MLFWPRLSRADGNPNLMIGVYTGSAGNGIGPADDYEAWANQRLSYQVIFDAQTGYTTQDNLANEIDWETNEWTKANRPYRNVLASIPLSTNQDPSLANVAAGNYDSYFKQAASALQRRYPHAIVRIGWEFNGNWFPWSAAGRAQDYIAAFRRVSQIFRAASPSFTIDWCTNLGKTSIAPDEAYPGDDVVDVISLDAYDQDWGEYSNATDRWNVTVNQPYGLQWHATFAANHGKPMGYPEWGIGDVNTGDDAYYINKMYQWVTTHNVLYASYWNSNAAYAGQLDSNQYPNAASAYLNTFAKLPYRAMAGLSSPVSPPPTATAPPAADPASLAMAGSFLIDAGASANYTAADRRVWSSDRGYLAGSGGSVDRGALNIAHTADGKLYQTERWCLDGYRFPVPNGYYFVRLHFAETSPDVSRAGERVFDVNVEGTVLSNLDVFREVGAKTALIKTVGNIAVTDAVLNIDFVKKTQCPAIDALEVQPTSALMHLDLQAASTGAQ
jgi:hypothetical protein